MFDTITKVYKCEHQHCGILGERAHECAVVNLERENRKLREILRDELRKQGHYAVLSERQYTNLKNGLFVPIYPHLSFMQIADPDVTTQEPIVIVAKRA